MDYLNIMIPILTAIITGLFALAGNYFANRKSAAVMEYRLQQLETKMEKHNQIIERTYRLEESTAIQEEKIKSVNHRIDDLERKMA